MLQLVQIQWLEIGEDLVLFFKNQTGTLMKMRCRGVESYRIETNEVAHLSQELDEHPLLWLHNKTYYDLYFTKVPQNPEGIMGAVFILHQKVVGDWIPIETFLNKKGLEQQLKLLFQGNGLFASGPKYIMEQYRDVLQQFDCQPSLLKNSEVTDEDCQRVCKLKALVLNPKFYILAEHFSLT